MCFSVLMVWFGSGEEHMVRVIKRFCQHRLLKLYHTSEIIYTCRQNRQTATTTSSLELLS